MRRRVGVAMVALAAAAVLSGCGPSSGTVVEKDHEPARWDWATCYRSQTTTSGGKTTTRQVPYSCQKYRAERHELLLRDVEVGGDVEQGWRTVPEKVYVSCRVGDFYADGGCRPPQ